jgi:hypothetical protein
MLPVERLEVRMVHGDREDDRLLTFEAAGRTWAVRSDALAALVGNETDRHEGSPA